jgi:hypothetical protein
MQPKLSGATCADAKMVDERDPRASEEESIDMVVPLMTRREFNLRETTKFWLSTDSCLQNAKMPL